MAWADILHDLGVKWKLIVFTTVVKVWKLCISPFKVTSTTLLSWIVSISFGTSDSTINFLIPCLSIKCRVQLAIFNPCQEIQRHYLNNEERGTLHKKKSRQSTLQKITFSRQNNFVGPKWFRRLVFCPKKIRRAILVGQTPSLKCLHEYLKFVGQIFKVCWLTWPDESNFPMPLFRRVSRNKNLKYFTQRNGRRSINLKQKKVQNTSSKTEIVRQKF